MIQTDIFRPPLLVASLLAISAIAASCSGTASVDDDGQGVGGGGGSTSTNSGSNTTNGGQGAACPASQFLDVSALDGAGAGYPAPELSVSCDGDEVVVTSNGIPHYEFVPTTPNDLAAQNYEFRFPLSPSYQQQTSEVARLGAIGVAVNGAPIYGPNEGAMPDPFGDPIYNDIMDDCLGHTGPGGSYHYHALLVKCLTQGSQDTQPSPIVGYAFDGFPIYGPYECADTDCSSVIELKSSWERTGDPTTYAWDNNTCTKDSCTNPSGEYLDQCNGHVGPGGDYHYHATLAKTEPDYTGFPYILGCYHGIATATGGMMAGPAGGGMAGPAGGGGMMPPKCNEQRTMMCCGDDFCGGPENAQNCPEDCS
jgi:hypothetical protein